MDRGEKRRFHLGNAIRQAVWSGRIANPKCSHLDQIQDVTPSAEGCEECLKLGDTWVHLRLCLICGKVGCCDNSKNKHATRHYQSSGHPLIQSFQPGEDWVWCYVDQVVFSPPAPE